MADRRTESTVLIAKALFAPWFRYHSQTASFCAHNKVNVSVRGNFKRITQKAQDSPPTRESLTLSEGEVVEWMGEVVELERRNGIKKRQIQLISQVRFGSGGCLGGTSPLICQLWHSCVW